MLSVNINEPKSLALTVRALTKPTAKSSATTESFSLTPKLSS